MNKHLSNTLVVAQGKSRIGVAAVVISLFLAAVDGTIVSTVLPSISSQLGDAELYSWFMSAFLIAVALIAPLAEKCADKFGVSRTLQTFMKLKSTGYLTQRCDKFHYKSDHYK